MLPKSILGEYSRCKAVPHPLDRHTLAQMKQRDRYRLIHNEQARTGWDLFPLFYDIFMTTAVCQRVSMS
jgi:hypothetical protein